MFTSRRQFLQTTTLLGAAWPLTRLSALGASAPAPSTSTASPHLGTSKAGLLFDAADIPRIRANLDRPRFAAMRQSMLEADLAADRKFLEEELRLNNHVTDQSRARAILERTAFAYVLFGDTAQRDLAKLALRRLLDYPKWDYFLEGGQHVIGIQRASEACIAVACALDWLGDALTAQERSEAEEALATKGAPACYRTLYGMKYPDRVRGWSLDPEENFPAQMDLSRWPLILNTNNLKVIPLCGLGFAALWLHGRHPETEKWLDMARQSARAFSTIFGLDGSYDEGLGYWGYTKLHLVLFAEALQRRTGIDETQLIDYPATARFALAMTMPTLGAPFVNPNERAAYNFVPKGIIDPAHDLVNFGDSGVGADVTAVPWIAERHNDPVCRTIANEIGAIKHLHGAIWYRNEGPSAPPEPELLDVRFTNDWVISRTGWTARDCVVAFRSGGPANHEHADRNSVIFKAHGERLFHDPFKAGYDPKGPRWLLRQTEAHTALLIGRRGHQYHKGEEGTNSSWAEAKIIHHGTGPGWMVAVSDATEAYQLVNDKVKFVERTLAYLKPDLLLILDRVQLAPGASAAVQARFQVNNEDGHGRASVEGTTFRIERPHAHLLATVHGAQAPKVRASKLNLPEEEGEYPYVEVESASGLEHNLLTIAAAAPAGEALAPLSVTPQNGGWAVTGTHRGRPVNVRIELGEERPRVSIS